MGRRRRAAAIASPSRVCAFSRTRSRSSSAWKVVRSATEGRPGALVPGPPGLADSFITVPLLVFCVRRFGEPLDGAEPPVPLRGQVSQGPGGLVEAAGFHLVENLPALFAPADQPSLFQHDQM